MCAVSTACDCPRPTASARHCLLLPATAHHNPCTMLCGGAGVGLTKVRHLQHALPIQQQILGLNVAAGRQGSVGVGIAAPTPGPELPQATQMHHTSVQTDTTASSRAVPLAGHLTRQRCRLAAS
jgi:hypothetical protein